MSEVSNVIKVLNELKTTLKRMSGDFLIEFMLVEILSKTKDLPQSLLKKVTIIKIHSSKYHKQSEYWLN